MQCPRACVEGSTPLLPAPADCCLVAAGNDTARDWLLESLRPIVVDLSSADSAEVAEEAIFGAGSSGTPWDVVVLDVDLGRKLVENVKNWLGRLEQEERPRVVLLGPVSAALDRREVRETGFVDLLYKPVKMRALLRAVLPIEADAAEPPTGAGPSQRSVLSTPA